ncbi:hypothetical protein BAZSYMA_ACONTIG00585_2 [Bathymodiolus azoricus thioautotrophic gill symbiont]|uniref:Uncharacterized protein n=1 Tax=Bathymodiolus azoricus thioautotrophic gill symbiont TaxID=235205 RepID=A0A1H6JV35_9GAMM|nr:hypothetical protein BAZSYMA_ACONTIG00585_2 [Bathymodiolus azoricus thioautotrophic gill symbiont]
MRILPFSTSQTNQRQQHLNTHLLLMFRLTANAKSNIILNAHMWK